MIAKKSRLNSWTQNFGPVGTDISLCLMELFQPTRVVLFPLLVTEKKIIIIIQNNAVVTNLSIIFEQARQKHHTFVQEKYMDIGYFR